MYSEDFVRGVENSHGLHQKHPKTYTNTYNERKREREMESQQATVHNVGTKYRQSITYISLLSNNIFLLKTWGKNHLEYKVQYNTSKHMTRTLLYTIMTSITREEDRKNRVNSQDK